MSLNFTACQQKESDASTPIKAQDTDHVQVPKERHQSKDKQLVAVWAKPYQMNVVNKTLCKPETADEMAACTRYDLQSIHTNLEWLDQYYTAQIKKNYAQAFGKESNFKLTGGDTEPNYYEGTMVSFINQRYNLVTFSQFNNSYSGGAHNIFHLQYDVFDLNTQKKLTLQEVLKPNAKAKLVALIKEQNLDELIQYGTDLDELSLSENFYFGEEGMVFVYSLYEIAPFVVGMPRFTIQYENLIDLIKTEYLPEQADMRLSREFS